MSSSISTLSTVQLSFLEDNFQVFHPETREFSHDFSGIPRCKIILLGEYHFSDCIHRVQVEFLKLFAKGRVVIPQEGLPPGIKLDKSKVRYFQDYPAHIDIIGADVRIVKDHEACAEYFNLAWDQTQQNKKTLEAIKKLSKQLAACLNDAVDSKKATLFEKGLKMTVEVQQEVKKIMVTYNSTELQNERLAIQKAIKEHNLKYPPDLNPRMNESNSRLLQSIRELSLEYDQIIAMWGVAHLYGTTHLTNPLGVPGSDFIILMPSLKLYEQFISETDFLRLGVLNTRVDLEEGKITTPIPHLIYYNSMIRSAFTIPPTPSEILLDSRELKNLFANGNTHRFPENCVICLLGIEESIYSMFCEQDVSSANKSELLLNAINGLLLFSQMQLSSLESNSPLILKGSIYKNKLCIKLNSKTPIQMSVIRTQFKVNPAYLFTEMRRRSISKYTWNAGASMIVTNIDAKDRAEILEDPLKILTWFSKCVPMNSKMTVQGSIEICPYTLDDELAGIAITAKTDASFVLVEH